jgi:methionyl-tRNA synthetase
VLVMINRDCGAQVPEPAAFVAADTELRSAAGGLLETVRQHVCEQAFHLALEAIWRVVGDANRYVDEQAPWVLRRTDEARMRTVLYTLAEVIRHLGILTQPFIPAAAGKLLDQLAVAEVERGFAAIGAAPLVPGTRLPQPEGIFPRFVGARAG